MIQWYYNDAVIGTCLNGDVDIQPPYLGFMDIYSDGDLVIHDIVLDNAGTYLCRRTHSSGDDYLRTPVVVDGKIL